ncbi:AbrB/MazE/SpoVT family DNA-binding domain-containing protein [Gloeocapsopsis sp. IPPAS B-1203]|uniref:AbrB/MazE/SpoVT family DNA-binding domain-containing protein n=1 Tax=Gloeocapsopsis sp. IPPAS B-1203 TaxID=2049454 RepID=UPI000C175CE9|nr:AbrB/MazE/SpoVT family DNA-binding domain-containing protein [Gloeocapsopsis sp. IPPAS B-1203]PIG91771.1 AbrB/MazE/SpoVT family DNA-binding domain-containing protein [Gloeocapsopsis sp. IPPAS B-1203]
MADQIVTKWGNSLGIRIPSAIAKQIHIEEGATVIFTVVDGGIMIQPQRRKYTLEELLEGMTPNNFHSETDTKTPVGNEVW